VRWEWDGVLCWDKKRRKEKKSRFNRQRCTYMWEKEREIRDSKEKSKLLALLCLHYQESSLRHILTHSLTHSLTLVVLCVWERKREREREQYCACQIVGRTNMTGCLAHTQTYYFERIRVSKTNNLIYFLKHKLLVNVISMEPPSKHQILEGGTSHNLKFNRGVNWQKFLLKIKLNVLVTFSSYYY
jgi:hypothetical protein